MIQGQRWKTRFANVARSPKSTVIGLCVLALAAAHGVKFDEHGRLMMTPKDWFEVGCGLLTAAVSAVSQDTAPNAATQNNVVVAGAARAGDNAGERQ